MVLMDIQVLALTKELDSEEKIQFQIAYANEKKSVGAGVLLALFLGGFGFHKFYLGQPGLGVLYLLFCWTFIPSIISVVEACFMGRSVRIYNTEKAQEICEGIKMVRS